MKNIGNNTILSKPTFFFFFKNYIKVYLKIIIIASEIRSLKPNIHAEKSIFNLVKFGL